MAAGYPSGLESPTFNVLASVAQRAGALPARGRFWVLRGLTLGQGNALVCGAGQVGPAVMDAGVAGTISRYPVRFGG